MIKPQLILKRFFYCSFLVLWLMLCVQSLTSNELLLQGPYAKFVSKCIGDCAAADFDGDGTIDLVVLQSAQNPAVHVLLNDGFGNFTLHTTIYLPGYLYGMDVADINGDSLSDIVMIGVADSTYLSSILNRGGSSFELQEPQYVSGIHGTDVILTSIDSDSIIDLVIINNAGGITLTDLDSDLDNDIVMVGKDGSSCRILSGNGDGYFTEQSTVTVGSTANYSDLVTFENNGGGEFSEISRRRPTDRPWHSTALLRNLGSGIFEVVVGGNGWLSVTTLDQLNIGEFTDYQFSGYWAPLTSTDVNGDGLIDLLNGEGILLRTLDFGFEEELLPRNYANKSALSADLDCDGLPELVRISNWCPIMKDTLYIYDNISESDTCCIGVRGNVGGGCQQQVDISDLSLLVDYLFRGGNEPRCPDETDVNRSGSVNISDLTYLVDYMFRGGPEPGGC